MEEMVARKPICRQFGVFTGFPGGSNSKESACNAGDPGSIPEFGRFPGERSGYPLQYSCLENPTDRGAWRATVPKVTESDTTEGLTLPVPLGVYRPHEGHPQLQSRKDPLLQRNKLSSWAGA